MLLAASLETSQANWPSSPACFASREYWDLNSCMLCNYVAVRLEQDELNSNSVWPISAALGFKSAVCFTEGAMVERFSGSDCLKEDRDIFKETAHRAYKQSDSF